MLWDQFESDRHFDAERLRPDRDRTIGQDTPKPSEVLSEAGLTLAIALVFAAAVCGALSIFSVG